MSRERERKYLVPEVHLAALRSALEQRATAREEQQDNTLYDFADGRLEAADSAVRVRRTADHIELAFKGPRGYAGAEKERDELEVRLDGDVEAILAAIGLRPALHYRKRATVFRLDDAVVSIDDVEGLPTYCEIEATRADADLEAVATSLGLEESWLERRGYPRLVAERDATAGERGERGSGPTRAGVRSR